MVFREVGLSKQVFVSALPQVVFILSTWISPLLPVNSALAIDGTFEVISSPSFSLYVEQGENFPKYDYRYAAETADEAMLILNRLEEEISPLFLDRPFGLVTVRFLSPASFYQATSAPSWTSALFSRGEIRIRISERDSLHPDELRRTLRHEYIHAVIAQLSDFHCPAWLDEGLAQLIEGRHNPRLVPALRKWISRQKPLPLATLHRGFLDLDSHVVPVAYAQSLYATQALIEKHGFHGLLAYLDALREGRDWALTFEQTFGYSVAEFEQELDLRLRQWASAGGKQLVWTTLLDSVGNAAMATTTIAAQK